MPVFACAGCGRPVVAVLGAKRERHFRHKATGDRACSKETYLHRLAKTLVAESFRAAVTEGRPYWLTLEAPQICRHWEKRFGFVCERERGIRQLDLTRYFDTARIEAGVEGFVADVLFRSSRTGERLLLEIVVSHECTPEKIASGLRILEIAIHEDVDLALLPTGIDTRRYWSRTHNFKPQKPLETSCRGRCDRNIAAFHVFESGKSFIKVGTPREIAAVMRAEKTVHSHIIDNAEHGILTPHLAGSGYHLEAMKAIDRALAGYTLKSSERAFAATVIAISNTLKGWKGSFRSSNCPSTFEDLDSWVQQQLGNFQAYLRTHSSGKPAKLKNAALGIAPLADEPHS